MARLGYDAVTPGDHELRHGLDSLRTLTARHPDIRVVSANLQDRHGAPVFPESVVIEKNGVRFGITGTTAPAYYRANLEYKRLHRDDFTFLDSHFTHNR